MASPTPRRDLDSFWFSSETLERIDASLDTSQQFVSSGLDSRQRFINRASNFIPIPAIEEDSFRKSDKGFICIFSCGNLFNSQITTPTDADYLISRANTIWSYINSAIAASNYFTGGGAVALGLIQELSFAVSPFFGDLYNTDGTGIGHTTTNTYLVFTKTIQSSFAVADFRYQDEISLIDDIAATFPSGVRGIIHSNKSEVSSHVRFIYGDAVEDWEVSSGSPLSLVPLWPQVDAAIRSGVNGYIMTGAPITCVFSGIASTMPTLSYAPDRDTDF